MRPSGAWVVLDRIPADEAKPLYCVHGRVTCLLCRGWCWLGNVTHGIVVSRQAMPICKECASRFPGSGAGQLRLRGHVADHLRVDGPHS